MIKTIKNAESNESTLRMLYSHKVDNSDKVKVEKKKSFPFLTFGIIKSLYFLLDFEKNFKIFLNNFYFKLLILQ